MNRRAFLSMLGALAALPVFGSQINSWSATHHMTFTRRNFEPTNVYVWAIASERIQRGALVVWDSTVITGRFPQVRPARDAADFSRHASWRQAAVAVADAISRQEVQIQTNGQMMIRAIAKAP